MSHAEVAPCGVYRLAQYAGFARDLDLVCIDAALGITIGERNGNLYFLAFLLDLFDKSVCARGNRINKRNSDYSDAACKRGKDRSAFL